MRDARFTRRDLARYAAALAVTSCGSSARELRPSTPSSPAPPWYASALVVDACGGLGRFDAEPGPGSLYTAGDVDDALASGVTAFQVTVDDPSRDDGPDSARDAVACTLRDVARSCGALTLVRSARELAAAKESGRVGLILGFQGAGALGPALEHFDEFHAAGVRVMQLTYNTRNGLGDGCLSARDAGLTALGRAAVERMNAAGVLVDLSHCGPRTTAEAIALSRRPVSITHTGCAALADLPRNKHDAELRACADRGGVVGIYFMPFLRTRGQPTAHDVVAHLEHAVDVCGEDHVGVGTDGTISAIELTPAFARAHRDEVAERRRAGISAPGESADVYNLCPDLNTPRRMQTLGERLLARGHSEGRVKGILGGNFARVLGEACGEG